MQNRVWVAFLNVSRLFKCRHLSLPIKIRLLRSYVFPVLLYGVESWTLTEAHCSRIESFEMWLHRRILRIPWTDHVTILRVLEKMGKDRKLFLLITTGKLEYFGHIIRNSQRYD